jgi:hypothetical protein
MANPALIGIGRVVRPMLPSRMTRHPMSHANHLHTRHRSKQHAIKTALRKKYANRITRLICAALSARNQ